LSTKIFRVLQCGKQVETLTRNIRALALSLGFDACGICTETVVDEQTRNAFCRWLQNGYQASMNYMEKYDRFDLRTLMPDVQSVLMLALNYFPAKKQHSDAPQIASYAYGSDYHTVLRTMLNNLLREITVLCPQAKGRIFCDTAPVLEKYRAQQAGIGFIGKNSLLIIPRHGSYYFLCGIALNIPLIPDAPRKNACGKCHKCMDACPTGALIAPFTLDARRCIAYHTIESREEIPEPVVSAMQKHNCFFGCDICQQVCPHNRFASPHNHAGLQASPYIYQLSAAQLKTLTQTEYNRLFRHSALKRAKYSGFMRNAKILLDK
jgi:epoxyqueuosine reductase